MARLQHTCTLQRYHRKRLVLTACRPVRASQNPGGKKKHTQTEIKPIGLTLSALNSFFLFSAWDYERRAALWISSLKARCYAGNAEEEASHTLFQSAVITDQSQSSMMNLSPAIPLNFFSQESFLLRTNTFSTSGRWVSIMPRRHNNRYTGYNNRPDIGGAPCT